MTFIHKLFRPVARRLDIHKLLAGQKQIGIVWSIEDVTSVREDLDDDQAWQVLLAAERNHDAEQGICWDVLEAVADSLFPTVDGEEL